MTKGITVSAAAVPSVTPHRGMGKAEDLIVGAIPTLAFLVVNGATGKVTPAVVVAAIAAAACFAWKIARHEKWWKAAPGLALVAGCAAFAMTSGEARGFFVLPMLIPFGVICVEIVTIVMGRPLCGLIFNPLSRGPKQWWTIKPVHRVYLYSTFVAMAIDVAGATLQVVFYQADMPTWMGLLHIIMPAVYAVLGVVTVIFVKRVQPRTTDETESADPITVGTTA